MEIPNHIEKFRNELQLKNYSANSIRTYIGLAQMFLNTFQQQYTEPKKIPSEVIKDYLRKSSSISVLKQNIGAIKLFYKIVVHQPLKFKYIEYPRAEKKLPRIIDQNEILSKIKTVKNLKHKTILALAYCCGLRVSEVVTLHIENIDFTQKVILIAQGKGNKDRYVPVSDYVLNLIQKYIATYNPMHYLFNGQFTAMYSVKSCQEIFKKYISTKYSFHHLRHSSFTAMLENGTDIRTIQTIAGHASPNTTAIYTHVSPKFLSTVKTPI